MLCFSRGYIRKDIEQETDETLGREFAQKVQLDEQAAKGEVHSNLATAVSVLWCLELKKHLLRCLQIANDK